MITHTDSLAHASAPDVTTPLLVQRVQAEYMEMPGLTLTVPQAARLWGLNVSQSQRLLSELVQSRFLTKDSNGAYRRRGCPRCS